MASQPSRWMIPDVDDSWYGTPRNAWVQYSPTTGFFKTRSMKMRPLFTNIVTFCHAGS